MLPVQNVHVYIWPQQFIQERHKLTLIRAAMTLILRAGWCLISSSIATPRLDAVSPTWSVPFFFLIAGRYSGETRTLNRWSKGSAAMKLWSPLVFKHMALSMLGRDERTSLVAGICLVMTELRTTPGRPLSWRDESWDGSWKMKTVVTSVAAREEEWGVQVYANGTLCWQWGYKGQTDRTA